LSAGTSSLISILPEGGDGASDPGCLETQAAANSVRHSIEIAVENVPLLSTHERFGRMRFHVRSMLENNNQTRRLERK